jgi:hypothetical protein
MENEMHDDQLRYYASAGPMTSFAAVEQDHPEVLDGLPSTPLEVAELVQGLLLHQFMGGMYGIEVSPRPEGDVQLRSVTEIVDRLLEKDARPLTERREPADRFFGNCRHFSTLAVAVLRRASVPSRARCGFSGTFDPAKWVDHWVVEHWDGERWVRLDAQIDPVQVETFGIDVDPTDLPADAFLTGGDAWQRCRAGTADGNDFGIADQWGQWFIPGNVLRDLAALNKVEMLPWDAWGALDPEGPAFVEGDAHDALVDELAALTASDDFAAITSRYDRADVRVPSRVHALFTTEGPKLVEVEALVDSA